MPPFLLSKKVITLFVVRKMIKSSLYSSLVEYKVNFVGDLSIGPLDG